MGGVHIQSGALFEGRIKLEQMGPSTVKLTVAQPEFDMELEALQQLHHTIGLFVRAARANRRDDIQYDTFTGAASPRLQSDLGGFP